jgi:5,10-methylenetetrahydromethanopterin reductase
MSANLLERADPDREYLTVLRPLLNGQPVRFDGEFFTVETRRDITAPAPSLAVRCRSPTPSSRRR